MSGPGALALLSVSGPGALCVGSRRSLCRGAGALCVGASRSLCRGPARCRAPTLSRSALALSHSLCRARRSLCRGPAVSVLGPRRSHSSRQCCLVCVGVGCALVGASWLVLFGVRWVVLFGVRWVCGGGGTGGGGGRRRRLWRRTAAGAGAQPKNKNPTQ